MPGGRVAALKVSAELTRKEIDDLHAVRRRLRREGTRVHQGQRSREARRPAVADRQVPRQGPAGSTSSAPAQAKPGDLIFFGADKAKIVNDALGALRLKLGHDKGLAEKGWRPLWVVDFPMFEWDEEGKRWSAMHHPFTAPKDGHEDLLASDPARALAKALRHGAERLGDRRRLGPHSPRRGPGKGVHGRSASPRTKRAAKFGFLLDNLQYGAPPHGGIAFGLDRMVALMAGADSIRDVIAFPKTQRAQDLLVRAPSPVDEKQLRELGLRLREAPREAPKT